MKIYLRSVTIPTKTILLASLAVVIVSQPATAFNQFYSDNSIEFADEFAESVCVDRSANISSGGTTANDFSLGTSAEERQANLIAALMGDYNLKDFQAAGIVGNFMLESGGADLPPDINEGGVKGPPKFKGGYGWPQWTGPRQKTFINFAVSNGYMSSNTVNATDAANYAYFKHEIETAEKRAIPALLKTTTVEQATESFMKTYERPGVPALSERQANARTALQNSGGTYEGESINEACVGGSSSSGIVGNVAFPLAGNKSVVKNPGMFKNGDTDQGGHPYTAYDILASPGTEVRSFMPGVVVSRFTDKCPGNAVSIYNKESNLTISYLHLGPITVAKNQQVNLNQPIGNVGSARQGCGVAHLHIDAVRGDRRVGCKRESCPPSNAKLFVNIGKELYDTYQSLPE
jgi:murein DD-endopeptidase MepM/ murein hydrolase activator NlpD